MFLKNILKQKSLIKKSDLYYRSYIKLSKPLDKVSQSEQVEEQKKRNKINPEMSELIRDFIEPSEFYDSLKNKGIDFFCGVPDSLLKGFIFINN
jgi:hypothetical protein